MALKGSEGLLRALAVEGSEGLWKGLEGSEESEGYCIALRCSGELSRALEDSGRS